MRQCALMLAVFAGRASLLCPAVSRITDKWADTLDGP
jgi:hypothetical protein